MYASSDDGFDINVRIYRLKSTDGMTNWTQDSAAIYGNTDFAWTDDEIRAPSVLLDGTTLHIWFAGTQSGVSPTLSLGHAECPL